MYGSQCHNNMTEKGWLRNYVKEYSEPDDGNSAPALRGNIRSLVLVLGTL